MDSFMPHLQTGLANWAETDVCRAAVGAVGDFCRALDRNVAGYCDVIVQKLLEALQAPNLDRGVKPEILSVLGDIALAIGEDFGKYLPFTMTMLMQAAASPIPPDADFEMIENIHRLRESVLEAITGIIQGVKTNREMLQQGMMQYAEQIMQFLKVIAGDEDCPEEVIKAATGVLGDMCGELGPLVKPVLQEQFVHALCSRCVACEDASIKEIGEWTGRTIQGLLATA